MAKPIWITKSQKISTITELEFFSYQLQAQYTDSYILIAGQLPNGLQLSNSGLLQGVPALSENNFLDGIYDFNFTVRAIGTESPYVIDRTFSISVSNIKVPEIVAPTVNLGTYEEGNYFDLQIEVEDFTPTANITWTVESNDYNFDLIAKNIAIPSPQATFLPALYPNAVTGQAVSELTTGNIWLFSTNGTWINLDHNLVNVLPTGLTLTSDGRLFGYFLRSPTDDYIIYNFSVVVTDGVNTSKQNYSLRVNRSSLLPGPIPPILLNEPSSMTPTKHDNFYSYKFEGYDFSDPAEQLEYFIIDSSIGFDTNGFDSFEFDPPEFDLSDSLVLDKDTGWLYGYLPQVNRTNEFKFLVGVKRVVDDVVSQLKEFTLTVNEFDTIDVSWITPSDLGSVNNGSISTLKVEAQSLFGGKITYSLLPYSINDPRPIRLPQGIRLTSEGLLVGRFSFRSFSLDNGNTTISDGGITTYGEIYNFTVLAQDNKFTTFDENTTSWDTTATKFFDALNTVSESSVSRNYRTFTVKVINRNKTPYENLYLKALVNKDQRQSLNAILQSVSWLDDDFVYRSSDPYYGRVRELRMLFLPGVTVTELNNYISSVELNHYRKNIRLSDIRIAQATDENLNPLYEVVYIAADEDQKTNNPNHDIELNLYNKLTNYYSIDGVDQTILYPNSFKNMRTRLLETLDLERRGVLPKWMTSVQRDGTILGLTYAIPLVYVRPGLGLIALQNLKEQIAEEIGSISSLNFAIDRYHVDKQLTTYWDFQNNRFLTSEYTRFYESNINNKPAVSEVDYAVTVPFDQINQANLDVLTGYIVQGEDVELVSPEVFPVLFEEIDSPLLPAWPLWMNDNAVWFNKQLNSNKGTNPLLGTTQVMERDFLVNTAGIYTMTVMNTDDIEIKIDGLVVGKINGYNVTNDPNNWFTTFNLSRGFHTITITTTIASTGSTFWPDNPKGFAVKILGFAVEVFNTRTFTDSKVKRNSFAVGPGLDGVVDIQNGQTLIFAQQDNFLNYTGDNNGWNNVTNLYGNIYDETGIGWEASTVVPGLNEKQNDIAINKAIFTGFIVGTTLHVTAVFSTAPIGVDQAVFGPNVISGTKITGLLTGVGGVGTYTINNSQALSSRNFYTLPVNPDGSLNVLANQRAGIWLINIDSKGTITLTFEQEVQPGDIVRVKKGNTYRGSQLILNLSPPLGRAELNYRLLELANNNETIFDGGDTEFIENRELYVDPGRGDKYAIYPKLGVFE